MLKKLTDITARVFGRRIGFSHDQIWNNDELYLERWILWFGFTLRLHRFHAPDNIERGIHSHPWWFWTWVLRGGYWETRWFRHPEEVGFWYSITGLHYSPASRRHAIMAVMPNTWTLVFTGWSNQEWGFYDRNNDYTPA